MVNAPACFGVSLKALQSGIGSIQGSDHFLRRDIMAHKKIERKKELDRRRKRREERLKLRIKEAKAAKKA